MPKKKTGRPKTEPKRIHINAHVLPDTHIRIKAQIIRNDHDLSSVGKVIDKQFEQP